MSGKSRGHVGESYSSEPHWHDDLPLPLPLTTRNLHPRGYSSRSSPAASNSNSSTRTLRQPSSLVRHPGIMSSTAGLASSSSSVNGDMTLDADYPSSSAKLKGKGKRKQTEEPFITDPHSMSSSDDEQPLSTLHASSSSSAQQHPNPDGHMTNINSNHPTIQSPSTSPPSNIVSSTQTRTQPTPEPQTEPLAEYTCPICFFPPTNATLTPCGHICCGQCLFTAVRSTLQRGNLVRAEMNIARCPVCRAEIPGWDGKGGGVVGLKVRAVFSL